MIRVVSGLIPPAKVKKVSQFSRKTFRSLRSYRIWNVFLKDCETFFNLAGGIYPETTYLIQDGSSPSLFSDQEIYLLFILEYNPCQAMLAL